MKRNTVILTVVSLIVLFGFLYLVYSLTNKPVQTSFPQINKLKSDDHISWSLSKQHLLIEYGDFQCPACGAFHPILQSFEASGSPNLNISKRIAFVFRHYPLVTVHQNALSAAYASEAASDQGKFWEMHNLLFENQKDWSTLQNPTDYFITLADKLKLNTAQFKKDLDSTQIKKRVEEDRSSGDQAQVSSTPTFFLDGKKLDIQTLDQFTQLLQAASANN